MLSSSQQGRRRCTTTARSGGTNNSSSSSSSRRSSSSSSWRRGLTIALTLSACMFLLQGGDAYTMQMTYKPPVKSSVSKLGNARSPSTSSTSTSRQRPDQSSASSRSRTSKNAAAASVLHHEVSSSRSSLSSTPSPSTKSFEERMRSLVMGQTKKRREPLAAPRRRNLPSNVVTVESLADYKRVVGDEQERVVAVRFYAPWCKACAAVAPLFYKMANTYPGVVFVDVPVTQENAKLHQGLGVPSLPFGHIYHPNGGLVEEVRISRKKISEFHHKLQSYVLGRCELKEAGDCTSPYSPPSNTMDEDEDDE